MGSDRVLGRRRDVATRDWPTDIRGATGTDRPTPVGLLPQRGLVVYLEQVPIQLLRGGKNKRGHESSGRHVSSPPNTAQGVRPNGPGSVPARRFRSSDHLLDSPVAQRLLSPDEFRVVLHLEVRRQHDANGYRFEAEMRRDRDPVCAVNLIADFVGNLGPVFLSELDDSTHYCLARNGGNCHTLKPADERDRRLRGVERRVGAQMERLGVDTRLDDSVDSVAPLALKALLGFLWAEGVL